MMNELVVLLKIYHFIMISTFVTLSKSHFNPSNPSHRMYRLPGKQPLGRRNFDTDLQRSGRVYFVMGRFT